MGREGVGCKELLPQFNNLKMVVDKIQNNSFLFNPTINWMDELVLEVVVHIKY